MNGEIPRPQGNTKEELGQVAQGMPLQASLNILVIEDEPGIIRGLTRLFQRDGHTIQPAINGQEALTLLQEYHLYDVILCDLRMPELDGPTFYDLLLRQYPALGQRIIFLTGDTLGVESQTFLQQCGQPWILKPCTSAQIRTAVEQVSCEPPTEGVV